jgi:hypothetical protein
MHQVPRKLSPKPPWRRKPVDRDRSMRAYLRNPRWLLTNPRHAAQ